MLKEGKHRSERLNLGYVGVGGLPRGTSLIAHARSFGKKDLRKKTETHWIQKGMLLKTKKKSLKGNSQPSEAKSQHLSLEEKLHREATRMLQKNTR